MMGRGSWWRATVVGISTVVLAGMAVLGIGGSPAVAATSPQLPSTAPFYQYSGSLAAVAPGTVLRSRTVSVPWLGQPIPLQATQLLYRTTNELGAPAVTVTTVLRLVGAGPGAGLAAGGSAAAGLVKIVSWQMFYDALGSECDPSYTLRGGNSSYGDAQEEEALMTPYLLSGDTLVVSDYEGENLAWGAGQQAGYETLDGIRAAEHWLDVAPSTTPVAMIGYSGGAIATQWAAEMAPAYAPGLDLVGAAAGGVPVDFAHNLAYINGSADWSGVIPAVLVGVSRAFDVDLTSYLSAYGRTVVHQVSGGCINSFTGSYPGLTVQSLLKPQYQNFLANPVFASIVNQLTMGSDGTPQIPMFLANGNDDGTGDGVMVAADVEALAHQYCRSHVPVVFSEYHGLDHTEAAVPFELAAYPTMQGWLAGVRGPDGCAAIGAGNSLAPLPAGTTPPAPPAGATTAATVTSVVPSGAGRVTDQSVTVTGHGAGALTVAGFGDGLSPVGQPAPGATGRSFDVRIAGASAWSSVGVDACAVGTGTAILWWDPAADGGAGSWMDVDPAPVADSGCLRFTVTGSTSPSLAELSGTVFAVTGPAAPSPPPASPSGPAVGAGFGINLSLGLL